MLSRPEFRAAYDRGLRRSSIHFTVFGVARPEASGAGPRFGITVTRKLGGAVLRNRVRRRTRELLRRANAAGWIEGAWNIVINPRPAVATAPWRLLAAELEQQVRKLGEALGRR